MPDHEDLLIGEFPSLPKQERAQQKRNALLESGRTLFISNGYEQTTAKEIAAHAGVATGTFYRYFSDKRQLLMSLLEDKLDKLLPPEPSWISKDPESLLASLLDAHNKRLNELGLSRVLPELMLKDPGLAEFLADARRKIYARILLGLKQAEETGLTWNDLDLDAVAWAIFVLVENCHGNEVHRGNKADFQEISKVICRMVFPPEVLEKLRSTQE
ncbi:TetR/AcrR family transcriptional regulator [Bacillus sp. sid0103]|uniref:TetR/AcrR family transcriptional regulator n=1 Tax=Bacillus sp. sid0103 TaxID=2856337 RepID=UPI001C44186B|nr:TetR/AcrR family transcriptional regulator [Bacillus sp. sid0103]MBV7504600.1 TetR/AcrR family transcriptional regulator [Bacillus sp. sid0103]